jgi:hypothetical protein
MSTEMIQPHAPEQDRQRHAEALTAESAGCHELLDRTALVSDLLERHLLSHPACVARPEWYLLAERAAAALRELYQRVGAEHRGGEE